MPTTCAKNNVEPKFSCDEVTIDLDGAITPAATIDCGLRDRLIAQQAHDRECRVALGREAEVTVDLESEVRS